MTFLEKFKQDHPNAELRTSGLPHCCPGDLGYCSRDDDNYFCTVGGHSCEECWNCEMPETEEKVSNVSEPRILDSGDRTEFESGAVRDMREGKGRCDLLPLNVVAGLYINRIDVDDNDEIGGVFDRMACFQSIGQPRYLEEALVYFKRYQRDVHNSSYDWPTMFLEVAKHFEEGAKKYGDNNWRKGIPVRCYIDSAVRHFLKYLRGDKDEPHDRAFCWNILCAIWTCHIIPELNDYAKKGEEENAD